MTITNIRLSGQHLLFHCPTFRKYITRQKVRGSYVDSDGSFFLLKSTLLTASVPGTSSLNADRHYVSSSKPSMSQPHVRSRSLVTADNDTPLKAIHSSSTKA